MKTSSTGASTRFHCFLDTRGQFMRIKDRSFTFLARSPQWHTSITFLTISGKIFHSSLEAVCTGRKLVLQLEIFCWRICIELVLRRLRRDRRFRCCAHLIKFALSVSWFYIANQNARYVLIPALIASGFTRTQVARSAKSGASRAFACTFCGGI